MKSIDNEDEQDRLVAIMKGSYIAKYFPSLWFNEQKYKEKPSPEITEMQKILKERLKRG